MSKDDHPRFANIWAEKSYELANNPGYLDKLSEVYRVDDPKDRAVSEEIVRTIRETYKGDDDAALVRSLFALDKKPVDEPYMRLLQLLPDAVEENPETVKRIARQHRYLEWYQLEGAIRAPIVANRQLGSRFSLRLKTSERFKDLFLTEEAILRSTEHIALLSGSDNAIKSFAARHLGYRGAKKPDFLAKCGDQYVVGEAKFFGDTGGNQNNQLGDAMSLVEGAFASNVRAIAVLDGVVWLRRSGTSRTFITVSSTKHDVMSALLLPEYLESLCQR